MSDTNQLERGLKNRHVQLLAIGGAIGTGLFLGSVWQVHPFFLLISLLVLYVSL